MTTLRIFRDVAEARATVLLRKPIEQAAVSPAVRERLAELFGAPTSPDDAVRRIVDDVRQRGDAALTDWTAKLDGAELAQFEVSREEIRAAYAQVPDQLVAAMTTAARRIRDFHAKQHRTSWFDFSGDSVLGQIVRPLERVGLYAPGGRAEYPSTLLMSAVPARVAGVDEVIVCTPPKRDGTASALTLVAADIARADRVFKLGGAQAIAALAYGTASVPRVDKILGPGNIFVTLAKRMVFGQVAIDQLAGPTETVVVADALADPGAVAADLLAQAEHDPMATAILLTDSAALAERAAAAVDAQLLKLPTAAVAAESLRTNGGAVVCASLDEAIELANEWAPEHLCLLLADAWRWLGRVRNAGGVFVGSDSLETMGDYIAGPSHVMPTSGTARFSSPLNVDDFRKVTSLIALGPVDLKALGPLAADIARAEGLAAHAGAVEHRLLPPPPDHPRLPAT